MKSKHGIFLLLLYSYTGFSQDWNLFVLNQNSYYKQQYDKISQVENFLCDSVLKTANAEILFFNGKSTFKPDCYKKLRDEIKDINWLKNPSKIDSLIKLNDSILYVADYPDERDTFIFKPFVKLNESWSTNGITIICSELGVADIFGDQDSVKTFTCSGNGFDQIEFILSKKHGFIKFLPFNEFLYHSSADAFPPYFELIGYSNGNTKKGYVQPDFIEYFHLKAGDRLFWRDVSDPDDPRIPNTTTYHVDSITFAYLSSDSVYYEFQRTVFNENGYVSNIGNSSAYYLRKAEGNIFQNHISWFGIKYGTYQPGEVFLLNSLYFTIENNDTITYIQYRQPGITIDTSACEIGYIVDYFVRVGYSTREGLIFSESYSWGENSTTLIGSIINGIKYGITDIPTEINSISSEFFSIYPNPFFDYITIDSQSDLMFQIEIYDITGNLICNKQVNNGMLNLSELKKGIYLLKIIDNNNTRQVKIIKY